MGAMNGVGVGVGVESGVGVSGVCKHLSGRGRVWESVMSLPNQTKQNKTNQTSTSTSTSTSRKQLTGGRDISGT